MPEENQAAPEPTIAAAVGISANSSLGGDAGKSRAARIEATMSQAVIDASANGLRVNEDAAQIRELMMAARQAILDEDRAPQPEG